MDKDSEKKQKEVLVEVRNLSVVYHTRLGTLSAVDDVSFDIYHGEILGLVGESGCGKSTMGKALMRMITPPAEISRGQIIFDGEDIMQYDDNQMRDFRGRRISMIFQDPMTSLNPVQTIRQHMSEAIQVHEPKTKPENILDRVKTLIERLGIASRRLTDYPHQLSGGMRQRVMIGLGLVLNAHLIIADEATTSLDVIVEAKLVDQLRQVCDEYGVTILAITHNIALVAELADRVAVMYAGQIAEIAPVDEIFDNTLHPYTQGLLRSVPNINVNETQELYKMAGEPPNLTHPPAGCRFHPRCPFVMPVCTHVEPALAEVAPGRLVHCWLYEDHPEKESPTIKVSA
ncbi:MAG: ABC transporter ATP-binding protein [Chloroflexota bacterium]|nr:MAG: ABC transporter ATP-binding protein [Chloroflexota bacterium]